MSAHGFEMPGAATASPEARAVSAAQAVHPVLGALQMALAGVNKAIVILASLALIAASVILSYSVVVRFVFHAPTYWQDEAAVFLLVGATFMTAAWVQGRRGHVAIEALTALLSPRVNAARLILVDFASFLFCAFFSWKSFTLLHEAWEDGHISSSTWGPPMWIPYSLMSIGMTLLTVQIALQLACALAGGRKS
ncbi:C4-dicarboxylate ABC transporter [Azorhizobium oxalatiphilum]|uniref:TRAP transporter small permease protein n=1 Tax=Azorhizobium oxalatiphilum TaxID=980631 RepID=A0A917C0L8_9HYPH|nr:TRAP transporter small permease [Azorhizobium oxalatiphilum]GGF66586.1 C4-dicarboxylate ABC transporter [Azorhizobium oxalatiphilum]